ncbi:MAG: polysulfide reductase NrfD [Calditrichaeota bacterium]|nr:polysulfide reductase NrfD [Calditrichota bacterium]MCB9367067.1 polysulfide reductase NrfD [Calditrichota bacterium]MCB9391449.1 polysulfide reductase NrfD [Calditrichota bacterium]
MTPGHFIAGIILAVGLPITFFRFTQGIGAISNLTDANPWGIWIGIDVLCGVALAAGGFIIGTIFHIFGMNEYKPLVRPAILTGFLGYVLVVFGLMFDLGRPWRLPYPMFWSWGWSSVMFEVGWCVALYLMCQFVEFWPPLFEWLGAKRLRAWAVKLTLGATVMAVVLSTLHQSSLGALFLIMPSKLHPLWYSMYLPVFFLISAISGGIGMIIFESTLSHSYFKKQTAHLSHHDLDRLTLGLSKGGAMVLFMYFWLKIIGVAHENQWSLLFTGWGAWWLVEVLGFILLPSFLFLMSVRRMSAKLARVAAVWTVIGLVLNRLNVSAIALNWHAAERYIPNWKEVWVTVMIFTIGVLVFKFIVNRMPILMQHPDYVGDNH